MKQSSPTVVVLAFSRPLALKRLLYSLNNAHYGTHVRLIISIDGGASREVISAAKKFEFIHGEKIVREQKTNLGLRQHVLSCGDLSETEGSVIILEDDIVVDKYYYVYAQQALTFYLNDDAVGGVSLYAPEFNEYAGLPFRPLKNEFDTYMMQVPCSWGQAWTSRQWSQFRNWMKSVDESSLIQHCQLPSYVKKWKSSSWKKSFALYLIDQDKYFIYPYNSFTTNVSDPGGYHNASGSSVVQVSLLCQSRTFRGLVFSPNDDAAIRYDGFMENCSQHIINHVRKRFNIGGSVCFDIYGTKDSIVLNNYDYCITSKDAGAAVANFPAAYRPVENNFLFPEVRSDATSIFKLCKVEDLSYSPAWRTSSGLLEYWAGFNFYAKKYVIANILGYIKRAFSKL